jgi:hypothetical protein
MKTKTYYLMLCLLYSSNTIQAQVPQLNWAERIGVPGGYTVIFSSAPDFAGNIYSTGHFEGTVDFDPGSGVYNMTAIGTYDLFVLKLDNNGNFIWARQMGGTQDNHGNAIAADGAGGVYITGTYKGTTDFDPGSGIFNLTSIGGTDIFVLALDSAGNFKWAGSIGGVGNDHSYSIAAGVSGNAYVSGDFSDTVDFDPGPGTFYLSALIVDAFILKIDASGNFEWAEGYGRVGTNQAYSLTLDGSENVYATGEFCDTVDFDPGPATYYMGETQVYSVFILKLDSSGNLILARAFISDFIVPIHSYSIALDAAGNIYTTGSFTGFVDFDPDTSVVSLFASDGIFVSKLDAAGYYVWAKIFTCIACDSKAVAVDAAQNVYSIGYFHGPGFLDLDPDTGVYMLLTNSAPDMYVSKLDSSGNFAWAFKTGGWDCLGQSIFTDVAGSVYVSGYFNGVSDFDPDSVNTYYLFGLGPQDGFIVKWDQSATGIIENIPADEYLIYPNPARDNFTIRLGKILPSVEITITNVIGRLVMKKEYKNTNSLSMKLEGERGMYFIRVKSENKTAVLKLVKN